jgi:D-serine deaminase-like pyridoxal phosphate-dependent protein
MASAVTTESADAVGAQAVNDLDTPAVVVDVDRLHANLGQMADLAAARSVVLRPHAKSHKSRALVRAQLDNGAVGITVAKLDEALGLSRDGACTDVFLAYPLASAVKADRAMKLAEEISLRFTIDTLAGVGILDAAAGAAGRQVQVMVEIDSGLARCGIEAKDAGAFAEQLRHYAHLDVVGVFSHAGQAYAATSADELREIARREVASVSDAAAAMRRAGVDAAIRSVGSTPTILTNVDELGDIEEVRPGNYVFKDRMQVALGVAALGECSLSVLATVVSTASGNAVIDAGSKVFGLDRGAHGNASLAGFGVDVATGAVVDRLSEEHGIITGGADRFSPGDRLRIIPNHACVVTDLSRTMYAAAGDALVGEYRIDVRGGGH